MNIDIKLYQTKHGIRCFINNLHHLQDGHLQKIVSFVNKREGGYFRYDLAEFGMRKKYSKEYLLKILKEYDIYADIVEPDNIEDRLSQIFSNITVNYNSDTYLQKLNFGEYAELCWKDIDEKYLYSLIEKYEDFKAQLAYYELKRRGVVFFDVPKIDNEYVKFGKYCSKKWSEVDIEYLYWLTKNYDDDRMRLALKEIEKRELSTQKPQQIEKPPKITFGKYRGKEWADVDTNYLIWVVNNLKQQDIVNIAKKELLKRDEK
jgi:uncharacterized protein (DUF3820 family)